MFFLEKTGILHNNKIAKTDKYVLWQNRVGGKH